MTRRSFDRVARGYALLERLTFGAQLQATRTALLPSLHDRKRILILGEGDGRFVTVLCQSNPTAQIVVVDPSRRMNELAEARVRGAGCGGRVEFRCADARTELPLEAQFDLVVCNFFLDCFDLCTIEALLPNIQRSLMPDGQLLLGDFRMPTRGPMRWLAPPLLYGMHQFFRWTAGIDSKRLVDLPALLMANGWRPLEVVERAGGFLHSSRWARQS